MSPQLLPADFDQQVASAITNFWGKRTSDSSASKAGARLQGGNRDAVLGGKTMAGFQEVIRSVATHCGLPPESVVTGGKQTTLPGFFRPTKNWDTLVLHERRLIAVF
jgi:hypothetical protein